MKIIEAAKMKTKDEVKETHNLFDDFSFWLQLANMNFASDLKTQMMEAEEQV